VIKTVKIKEKLKIVWEKSDKPVSFKTLMEITDYAINHENMESSALQKNLKTKLEKDELEEQ